MMLADGTIESVVPTFAVVVRPPNVVAVDVPS